MLRISDDRRGPNEGAKFDGRRIQSPHRIYWSHSGKQSSASCQRNPTRRFGVLRLPTDKQSDRVCGLPRVAQLAVRRIQTGTYRPSLEPDTRHASPDTHDQTHQRAICCATLACNHACTLADDQQLSARPFSRAACLRVDACRALFWPTHCGRHGRHCAATSRRRPLRTAIQPYPQCRPFEVAASSSLMASSARAPKLR